MCGIYKIFLITQISDIQEVLSSDPKFVEDKVIIV